MWSQDVLGPDGPLASRISGFRPRRGQREMAARIERALAGMSVFIAESGTGTGKTFAYLVPALLSGKKILISTGTKPLQDQLYNRDLPLVAGALGRPVSRALLKGRANYLCLHRLERTALEGRFEQAAQSREFRLVQEWARRTREGDIAEVDTVAEDSALWPRVTSTVDNCLGGRCEHHEDCFVARARRTALEAEVLVINHHLFFADLALKEEGFGQLLPGADAVIFDEAHQLPEIASVFLSQSVGSHQLVNLARDTVAEELREKSAVEGLRESAQQLEKATADFRLAFDKAPERGAWQSVNGKPAISQAADALRDRLAGLLARLEQAAPKGQGLAQCCRRASELLDKLHMLDETSQAEYIAWYDTTARGFGLYLTPLDIAGPFQQAIQGQTKSWIFTSATLAINGSFDHFQRQLGLEQADTGLWESPFDFRRQALLYLPRGLPLPAHPEYTSRVIECALPVLQASGGRAFFLFTSHRALRLAAEQLPQRLDHPVLVQGQAPRPELLDRFRNIGDAVLLGTGSFWEGVDVRGEALSCVIIDKLPFAAPDDPVMRARGQAMEQAGRNPFMEYQLPAAVIALKQGAGRLIRDEEDRGVLMLCDPRLLSKGYGRVFLNSLPPMSRTHELADVQAFFGRSPDPVAQTAGAE